MKRFTPAVAAVLSMALGSFLSAEDKVARGKHLYEEQKCRMWHNVGGVGNPKSVALDEVGSNPPARGSRGYRSWWHTSARSRNTEPGPSARRDIEAPKFQFISRLGIVCVECPDDHPIPGCTGSSAAQ
jgi:hypothetical protein